MPCLSASGVVFHEEALSGWYLRQKPVGGSKAGGLPTLPFSLPSAFSLSFQTNQWEGRSVPVRGSSPAPPPYKYHPIGAISSVCTLTFTLGIVLVKQCRAVRADARQNEECIWTVKKAVDWQVRILTVEDDWLVIMKNERWNWTENQNDNNRYASCEPRTESESSSCSALSTPRSPIRIVYTTCMHAVLLRSSAQYRCLIDFYCSSLQQQCSTTSASSSLQLYRESQWAKFGIRFVPDLCYINLYSPEKQQAQSIARIIQTGNTL